ncbi:hypothetical protein EfmAA96_18050 [Enterococcus faecium]|nr:hypothetical protein EfmAA96_18050 [Enterococcus faecium]
MPWQDDADLGLDWLKPIANGKESGMLSIKKQKSLKINNRVLSAFCNKLIELKNSLTGLPIGGGKGGSDFDPKGKSDNEIIITN